MGEYVTIAIPVWFLWALIGLSAVSTGLSIIQIVMRWKLTRLRKEILPTSGSGAGK